MAIAITIIAAVLLTAAAIAVSRAGGRHHQEDLNDHQSTAPPVASGHAEETGHPDEPKTDRPAGPGAEAMGVSEPGEPSPGPTSERRR